MNVMKEISRGPWEAEEKRQSKGWRSMERNTAEEKRIGKKWCEEKKGKNHVQICTEME